MKKMLAMSLVLAAALAAGCSKKQPQTTPQPPAGATEKTEAPKEGDAKAEGGEGEDMVNGAPDPCDGPK